MESDIGSKWWVLSKTFCDQSLWKKVFSYASRTSFPFSSISFSKFNREPHLEVSRQEESERDPHIRKFYSFFLLDNFEKIVGNFDNVLKFLKNFRTNRQSSPNIFDLANHGYIEFDIKIRIHSGVIIFRIFTTYCSWHSTYTKILVTPLFVILGDQNFIIFCSSETF
jgi:hypothetical protein